jgi:hypothetical protein
MKGLRRRGQIFLVRGLRVRPGVAIRAAKQSAAGEKVRRRAGV